MIEQLEIGQHLKRVDGKVFQVTAKGKGFKNQKAIRVDEFPPGVPTNCFVINLERFKFGHREVEAIDEDEFNQLNSEHAEFVINMQAVENAAHCKAQQRFGLVPGNWIRKQNWTFFGKGKIVLQLHEVKGHSHLADVFICGKHSLKLSSIVIITEEEATALQAEFDALRVADPVANMPEKTQHYRDDNGEAKVAYTDEQMSLALETLFTLQKKNPTKPFELYKCSFCAHYHIGRRPSNEVIAKYQAIAETDGMFQAYLDKLDEGYDSSGLLITGNATRPNLLVRVKTWFSKWI